MEKECEQRIKDITESFSSCTKALLAIGDETRQCIILALLQQDFDGIRVGEIAKHTHLSRPAVSHHLHVLKEAGIVNMRRVGTKNYYYLDSDSSKWKMMLELTQKIYTSVLHLEENDPRKREDE